MTTHGEFEDMEQVSAGRAATYGLLARLYRTEVDEALLKELRGMRVPASTGNEDVDAGYRAIAACVANAWDGTLTELAADYFHVFYGEGVDSYSAAHPFESVYTSPKRLLMQDARDEVLAIYRAAGLDKDPAWREGEDHIALELEYLKVMAARTAEALGAGDEDAAAQLLVCQRNFMDDHVLAWTPMLTADMRRFAKTGFYLGLAQLTDGFLETDRAFLDEVLGR